MTRVAASSATATPPLDMTATPNVVSAETLSSFCKTTGFIFPALAFAFSAKVLDRVWKYDSDQFYAATPKLDAVLLAVVAIATVSEIVFRMRNRG